VLQFEVKTAKQSRKTASIAGRTIRDNFRCSRFIQIVSIALVAVAQEVLCAERAVPWFRAMSETRRGALPRRCFANCKRAAEIYPPVTLCLIDVCGLFGRRAGKSDVAGNFAPGPATDSI
jgi:hypothetical protein